MDVVESIRREIGLSRRAFAKLLGVDERTLARLEAGAPARGRTIGLLAVLRRAMDDYGPERVRLAAQAHGGRMEAIFAAGIHAVIQRAENEGWEV